jgi:hypothetical protein
MRLMQKGAMDWRCSGRGRAAGMYSVGYMHPMLLQRHMALCGAAAVARMRGEFHAH